MGLSWTIKYCWMLPYRKCYCDNKGTPTLVTPIYCWVTQDWGDTSSLGCSFHLYREQLCPLTDRRMSYYRCNYSTRNQKELEMKLLTKFVILYNRYWEELLNEKNPSCIVKEFIKFINVILQVLLICVPDYWSTFGLLEGQKSNLNFLYLVPVYFWEISSYSFVGSNTSFTRAFANYVMSRKGCSL